MKMLKFQQMIYRQKGQIIILGKSKLGSSDQIA